MLLEREDAVQVLPRQSDKGRAGPSAATWNLALNAAMYSSRRKRLASSSVWIPRSRSSCGSRPCQVPKLRSERPRAYGE
ncbi:MAG: hypothetical protein WCE63_04935 [Acidobacteriaceae bacterium]